MLRYIWNKVFPKKDEQPIIERVEKTEEELSSVEIGEIITYQSPISKKILLWDLLKKDICPGCGKHGTLAMGMTASILMNMKCVECNTIFKKTNIRSIGAFYK